MPDYTKDVVDEEFLNAFTPDNDEKYDEDYVEAELQPIAGTEAKIDTAATLGIQGEAKQFFFSAVEANEFID